MSFSDFGLDPKLMKALHQLGFTEPTPIQNSAIAPVMQGRDVMAAAKTGSGKTAAFLLPLMNNLLGRERGTTRVLVLEPTREMAAQIVEHMGELGRFSPLKGAAVYGGVGMNPQEDAFRRGFDIIAATPGRLLDHMQYPYAKLAGLEVLILDEADRMLDMGFLPDIKRILKQLPAERQTLLFSATMPLEIVELAKSMLKKPVMIDVERQSAPAEGITHTVYPIHHELKSRLLLEILRKNDFQSVLAFTRTKHRANRLADFLEKNGVPAARLHGSRSQAQRTEALKGFKKGNFRVLVATDIAARGIDVEALGLVVNFDVPNIPEDYIHRVGRTARADATGDAFTFVSPSEENDLRVIEKHIGRHLPRAKVHGFDYEQRPEEKFEIPIGDRIAEIRARKAEERARAKAKAERRAAHEHPPQGKREFKTTREEGHPHKPQQAKDKDQHVKQKEQARPRRDFGHGSHPHQGGAPGHEKEAGLYFDEFKSGAGKPKHLEPKSTAPREEKRIPVGFSLLREVYKEHLKPGVDPEAYEEQPGQPQKQRDERSGQQGRGAGSGDRKSSFRPRDDKKKPAPRGKKGKRGTHFMRSEGADGKPYFTRGKSGEWEAQTSSQSPGNLPEAQAGDDSRNRKRSTGKPFTGQRREGSAPPRYPDTKKKKPFPKREAGAGS